MVRASRSSGVIRTWGERSRGFLGGGDADLLRRAGERDGLRRRSRDLRVNFINILLKAFTNTDPKKRKKGWDCIFLRFRDLHT